MSLLQFHMLAYEILKFQQELLIIIFIISIIIIIVIIGTRCGVIIFLSQANFCSTKTGYSGLGKLGLENQTIRFSQTDRLYLFLET
jgi:hypothetical protein